MANILAYASPTSSLDASAPSTPELGGSSPGFQSGPTSNDKAKATTTTSESSLKSPTEAQKEALRNYSDKVQNFTYRLFLNFEHDFKERQNASKVSSAPRKYPKRTLPRMQLPEGSGL